MAYCGSGRKVDSISYTFLKKGKSRSSFLWPLGPIPVICCVSKKGLPSRAYWKIKYFVTLSLSPVLPLLYSARWTWSRWNKAGGWKCSQKNTSWNFQYTSLRDNWFKGKIVKSGSRRYIHNCKVFAFCLPSTTGRRFRPEKHTWREGYYGGYLVL